MLVCMYVRMYSLYDNLNIVLHNYTLDTDKHPNGDNIGMLSGYGIVHNIYYIASYMCIHA